MAAADEPELAMGEAFSALTPLSFMAMVSRRGARRQGRRGGGAVWRGLMATAGGSLGRLIRGEMERGSGPSFACYSSGEGSKKGEISALVQQSEPPGEAIAA